MIIKNGNVFISKGEFAPGDVVIGDDGLIGEVSMHNSIADGNGLHNIDTNEVVIDATGMYVIPGLTDIHIHGALGCDFCDASIDSIEQIAKYELDNGITSICPTSMTYDEDKLANIFSCIRNFSDNNSENIYPNVLGINMEGPFISKTKKGAQNEAFICQPDIDMFNRLYEVSGNNIRLVTVAPEIEGACDFIRNVSESVHVSIGHTNADYGKALEGLNAGADHITHMYNGMTGFEPRRPGVIGAAFDEGKCYVELIGDCIHSHPAAVKMAFSMYGTDRIVLISDTVRAGGMADGVYELGGQTVYKTGNEARLSDGTIAGSTVNLMETIRLLTQKIGIEFAIAVKCATVNPVKSIGMYDKYGSIEQGKYADVLILDRELNIKCIIKGGKIYENTL